MKFYRLDIFYSQNYTHSVSSQRYLHLCLLNILFSHCDTLHKINYWKELHLKNLLRTGLILFGLWILSLKLVKLLLDYYDLKNSFENFLTIFDNFFLRNLWSFETIRIILIFISVKMIRVFMIFMTIITSITVNWILSIIICFLSTLI